MPEISQDIVALLQFLLPGFLVAMIFYGLTSHKLPSQFERVVQALIFTLIVKVCVSAERFLLEYLGQWVAVAAWGADGELAASILSAILLGFFVSYLVNNDYLHRFIRNKGLSSRSSHPSEWFGILTKYPRFTVLHLEDGRRIYGWPNTWPSDPEQGHFYLVSPSWLDEEGNEIVMDGTEGILVNVKDVAFVELVKKPESRDEH